MGQEGGGGGARVGKGILSISSIVKGLKNSYFPLQTNSLAKLSLDISL